MSQQSKRAAVACTSPLSDSGLMRRILELTGPGRWLLLGAVCKAWRDVYAEIVEAAMQRQMNPECPQQTARVAGVCTTCAHDYQWHTHSGKYTAFSAVFASASCVREAHNGGFHFKQKAAAKTAGQYVDSDTLLQAHQLGLPYSDALCEGIVARGDLALMQWIQQQEPAAITNLLHDDTIVFRRRNRYPGLSNFESLAPSSSGFESPILPRTPLRSSLTKGDSKQTDGPISSLVPTLLTNIKTPVDSTFESPAGSPRTPRRPNDDGYQNFSFSKDPLGSPPRPSRLFEFEQRKIDMVPAAISSGSMELLLWLLQRGATLSSDSLQRAATAGHLHMVILLTVL
jgi:hypothetical protein